MPQNLQQNLVKLPGASHVKRHLLAQGHTEREARVGALGVAVLLILLTVLLFNAFVWGALVSLFSGAWHGLMREGNEDQAVLLFAGLSVLFVSILLLFLNRETQKKEEVQRRDRFAQQRLDEKRAHLARGAMGNFEELFRHELTLKRPDLEVRSVHTVDAVPRVRFKAYRPTTAFGGKVGKSYEDFRNRLFGDVLGSLEVAFRLSPNIPFVIVDALMEFINRKAEYYEGTVLSVRAQKEAFEKRDPKASPFKVLITFDLRYKDGMEIQPIAEEESKQARVIERIRQGAPVLNVRYEAPEKKAEDGWEKPPEIKEEAFLQETLKGKELNALSPSRFQDLVVGVLAKMNYDLKGLKKVPGGTLQVQADYAHPVIGGSFLILARQFPESAPIHVDLVKELDGLAREESCKRGCYIVTGHFTEEAKNIARKMAVDLVDVGRLAGLLEARPYDGRWSFRVVDEKGVTADLARLSILDFEKETALFLKSAGFQVVKIRRVPGGAVVAVAEHDHPITGGKFAVMARQVQGEERVPAELVSELSHVMDAEFCHRGLLMVTGDLSREAQALARVSGVELVDRNLWENMRRHI